MRLRVSSCGCLFIEEGQPRWDDYLGHAQFELGEQAIPVLRWFADWREVDSVRELGDIDRVGSVVDVLLRHHVLVEEYSRRYDAEKAVTRTWSDWGVIARAFHFSTRTDSETAFLSIAEQSRRFDESLAQGDPPTVVLTVSGTGFIQLPRTAAKLLRGADLFEVLAGRRSHRAFGDDPIPLESFAALLDITAGISEIRDRTATVLRTSPSGGGRHPTELFVQICSVDGIDPGVYHYNGRDHLLARIADLPAVADRVRACGDQRWVVGAAALVFFVSQFERNLWKYDAARSYRVLQLDVGHLNQTLSLAATALGLHTTFTAALRDELVEQQARLDPVRQLVLGCAVLGTPTSTPAVP